MTLEEAITHLLKTLPTFDDVTQTALKIVMSKSEFMKTQVIDEGAVEEWHNIEGYAGVYQVSNLGRVRSRKHGNRHILKPTYVKGCLQIGLSLNGKCRKFALHVLVARAFIPNPENKPMVNHKDANPMNCQVSNLEWVSASENTRHAFNNGLIKTHPGVENYNSRLSKEDVLYIRKNYKPYDRELGMSALAKKFKVNMRTMMEVIQGKTYKNID